MNNKEENDIIHNVVLCFVMILIGICAFVAIKHYMDGYEPRRIALNEVE